MAREWPRRAGVAGPARLGFFNRDTVSRLEPAWTYRTGETEARLLTKKPAAFEATPLVVDGVMYVGTPLGRVIALDAGTGRERWVFDPRIDRDVTDGDFASRGVSTWLDESSPAGAPCRRRISPPPRNPSCLLSMQGPAMCARDSVHPGSSTSSLASAYTLVRAPGVLDDLTAGRRQRSRDHRDN